MGPIVLKNVPENAFSLRLSTVSQSRHAKKGEPYRGLLFERISGGLHVAHFPLFSPPEVSKILLKPSLSSSPTPPEGASHSLFPPSNTHYDLVRFLQRISALKFGIVPNRHRAGWIKVPLKKRDLKCAAKINSGQ